MKLKRFNELNESHHNEEDFEKGYDLSDKKLDDVVMNADLAFWDVVAESYPEVQSGDFPPDATFEIHDAMKTAINRWLDWNHPDRQNED
jgi:hypothetical protein